jgi:hypothetical protein
MDKTLLTREAILQAKDLPFEDVKVPEWNGTVRIAGLTGKAATEFSAKMVSTDSRGQVKTVSIPDNFMAELLSMTIVDTEFRPVFSKADIEALGGKSAAVLKRLSETAMRLSGLGEEAEEQAQKN